MWVALLDGKPVLGFNHRPKLVETDTTIGFRDGVDKIGCHVEKNEGWKEFKVERLGKGSR